ncbi:MAG: hypothetical protein WKF87_04865 [Chryseolinea sp.]
MRLAKHSVNALTKSSCVAFFRFRAEELWQGNYLKPLASALRAIDIMQSETLIWHYTSNEHLKRFLIHENCIFSKWEADNGVKPRGLWLSTNPVWEHAAPKAVEQSGKAIQLTKDQQHERFGLVRIAIILIEISYAIGQGIVQV